MTVAPARSYLTQPFILAIAAFLLISALLLIPRSATTPMQRLPTSAVLPLAFIPNEGQLAPEVQMQVQGQGGTLYFLQNEVLVETGANSQIRLQWENANTAPTIEGTDLLPGVANVMHGNDASQWHTEIPMYGGVRYENLYLGIDLQYQGNDGTLKGTYSVAAGVATNQIRWHFEGAQALALTTNGDLEITLPDGQTMVEKAPVSWQIINGSQVLVPTQYVIDGQTVGFVFPQGYDATRPLTIDPTLLYSSYIGGNAADETRGVAVDPSGNIYLYGETFSSNLLGQNHTQVGSSDLFIAKLNPAGTQVMYLTVMGSPGGDYAKDLQVDAQGNAFLSAYTLQENFPTRNAMFPTAGPSDNAVLVKVNGSGVVQFSTYMPLRVNDVTHNLALDNAGNPHMTGVYVGAVDPEGNFLGFQVGLFKLNTTGQELLMGLHIGAAGRDSHESGIAIDVDDAGNIYIVGNQEDGDADYVFGTPNAHQPICGDITGGSTFCSDDGFIYVVSAASELTYASYHGGKGTEYPTDIVADGKGNVLVVGTTTSPDFPTANALQTTCPIYEGTGNCNQTRGFVSMINIQPTQSTMTYSTYWGAPERDSNNNITAATLDDEGNAYVVGWTNGLQFPMKDPIQGQLYESFCSTFGSERYCFDSFVSKFTPTGQLSFSTFFGAVFDEFPFDITLDNDNNILFVGLTEANDFPTTSNAIQPNNLIGDDGFLVKIGMGTSTPPTVTVTTTTPPITPVPNAKRLYLPAITGRP